ncbi:hypothetical protein PISL3812_06138 [Talaromyces islandicus]|uniref:DUF7702 domain-containing protein n=1 Tax=Talaromyces islandicus TaxID=28573 RepID=A0A0U1M0P3_TALIS|nr:hypothetical protein PISL3812_06138 [Talaromyces islandicus]
MIPVHADKVLDILQLVLYIPLLLLSQYCLLRHGRRGILGWFYVGAFCMIRLIAAGLKIHSDNTTATQSSGATIVDNIGLSPVILAALGLLHEARTARGSVRNTKIEWLVVLQIHMLVTAGLALVAVGVSSLFKTKPSPDSAMTLLKAGFAIMFLGWGIIVGLCLWSFRRPTSYDQVDPTIFRDATILLNAVFFSLPFILLRAIYGALNLFGSGNTIGTSSFSSNVPADVIMNVLAQLAAAVIFVVAGVRTVRLGAMGFKENSHPL